MRIGITLFLAWVHIPSSGLRTRVGNLAELYDQLSILSKPDPNRSSRHHQCSIPTSIRNKNTRGTFSSDSWMSSSPPWLTPHFPHAFPHSVFSAATGVVSTARVERGSPNYPPSPEGAGKPSFTARIERPPLYRGGSASKKDGCLPPRILLIVRVPGARDQHGCHSSPFTAQFTFPLADFLTILLESAHTYA